MWGPMQLRKFLKPLSKGQTELTALEEIMVRNPRDAALLV